MDLSKLLQRARQYVLQQQWVPDPPDLPRGRRLLRRAMRTLTLAAYEFLRKKCTLRAASLTLVFVFSLAPAMALGFSVAKGFGAQERIRPLIYQHLGIETEQTESPIKRMVDTILSYVDQTDAEALGLAGLVLVLYTSYRVLSSIEKALNDVWGVRRSRKPLRKLVDYLAVLFVFPLMLMLAALAIAALKTGPVMQLLRQLMPRGLLGLLGGAIALTSAAAGFWFLYYFFPNTRVPASAAAAGAIVAAICWGALQFLYVQLQIGVARYNAIYGAFAAVPIFLLWLQCAWMVVLFGAEVSYAHAHVKEYEHGGLYFVPSAAYRERLGLGLMVMAARAFQEGTQPPSMTDFSRELAAPLRVVRDLVGDLQADRLLVEVVCDEVPRYQPATPPEQITVGRVLRALNRRGDEPARSMESLSRLGVAGALDARDSTDSDILSKPILRLAQEKAG